MIWNRTLLLASILISAFSCASSKQYAQMATGQNVAQTASIYVIRDGSYGQFVAAEIFSNEQLMGELGPKGYLVWTTEAPSVSVKSKIGKPTTLKLDLEPGKTYYIHQKLNPFGGVLRAASVLTLLSEDEGQALLQNLKSPVVADN